MGDGFFFRRVEHLLSFFKVGTIPDKAVFYNIWTVNCVGYIQTLVALELFISRYLRDQLVFVPAFVYSHDKAVWQMSKRQQIIAHQTQPFY